MQKLYIPTFCIKTKFYLFIIFLPVFDYLRHNDWIWLANSLHVQIYVGYTIVVIQYGVQVNSYRDASSRCRKNIMS